MRRTLPAILPLILVVVAILFILNCSSAPQVIEEGLTPAEYFQRAQEASDGGRYSLAQKYYEKFLVVYPEERDRGVWARYEIALLYYKMGQVQEAARRFDALLAEYQAGDPSLPAGPRILAEKLKARIEAELPPEAQPSS